MILALAVLVLSSHALEGGWGGVSEGAAGSGAVAPATWGNVSGSVLDAWGKPSAGIPVKVEASSQTFEVVTDSVGFFLVSGIPLAGDADTVVATVGDGSIWPSLRVACPPGAVMAPRLLFQPGQAGIDATPRKGGAGAASGGSAARAMADATPWAGPWTVFATREGLVGFTTANGHVIKQADHFVALPSKRGLNANDSSREFMVELVNGAKRVQVPVMDIGPWNTKDDWWHDTLREMFSDLPRGTPEALAAFRDGYNAGIDGSGRKVLNAAGIDLADGVFWDDLGLVNNANIEVRLLWKLTATKGDRVRLKQWANVRDSAGGKLVFKALCGETGTVAGTPRAGLSGSKWYLYWPVTWDRGTTGWVVENYLTRDTGSVVCTDAVRRREFGSSRLRADARGVSLRLERSGEAVVERLTPEGRILSRVSAKLDQGENRLALPRPRGLELVRVRVGGDTHIAWRMP